MLVGLTGGIGAGKSAVAELLAEHGAIVLDADRLAREVVAPGTPALQEIVDAFGRAVLGTDGQLDRARLARLVFADADARRRLEEIVHPRVRERTAALAAAAPPDSVIVNDVPLLVEAGLRASFDLVIVVLATEELRVLRLMAGRGMAEAQARERMATQATDEQRRAVADVVIDNNGTLDELRAKVDAVWRERIEPGRDGRR